MDELRRAERDRLRYRPSTGRERVLAQATDEPVARDLRARVFELGEALFQSIHMQLSVPRYQAIGVERGANLDAIDAPLNNRRWLESQFAVVRALADETERLRAVDAIVSPDRSWTRRVLRRSGQSVTPAAPRAWTRPR